MEAFKKYILLYISAFVFFVAAITEHQTIHNHPELKAIQRFQETLLSQELKLGSYLTKAELKITENLKPNNYASTFADLNHLFEDEGLGFIVYKKMKMIYWSNNQFAFQNILHKVSVDNKLISLPNGIYVAQTRIVGNYQIIGLIHLKNNYSYENQLLVNTYISPFKLPSDYKINISRTTNAVEIHDLKNQYLFTVLPSDSEVFSEWRYYIPSALYLLGFVLLLTFIYQKTQCYQGRYLTLKMPLLFVSLAFVYLLHIGWNVPAILNHTGLFSAKYYAFSSWLPSFGDFLLIGILFFFWSFVFAREFSSDQMFRKKMILPAYLFSALLYQLVGIMIDNLVSNSNINYKLNHITDVDQYSIIGYLVIAMLLFSVFLVHLKILQRTESLTRRNYFFQLNLLAGIVVIVLCAVSPAGWSYMLVLFFAVNLLRRFIKKMHIGVYSLSYSIIFVSLFSVISLIVVYNTVKRRDLEFQKLRATTLSTEQDPVAEILLSRMQLRFEADTIIPVLLKPPYERLKNYINRTYFSGYFRKYDVQIIPCAEKDSVKIDSQNIFVDCFPYFEKMITQSGTKVPGSDFYFMNNTNGGVSYFGRMHYSLPTIQSGISVFIELDLKLISEGIGFPELLIDRSLEKPFRYKYLSYAKYYDEELVSFSGNYSYKYYSHSYPIKTNEKEFQLMNWDGYDHLIYRPDNKTQIIVSNQSFRLLDYLISFPYIFVFYFAFILIIFLIRLSGIKKMIVANELRFRIQSSIISVVLISNLFVASGTIYYNIRGYRSQHQTDLDEKIKSVSEEIKFRLTNVNAITPDLQQWLFSELNKLSNVFRTDINIYDTNGELLVTSRPEIFDKGIMSERMDSRAFYELSEHFALKYFQPEKIGTLSYLSAYEPVINGNNEYLGYLNLPYFTREDDLKQGISTFIVAFINLYLILFLASVILAVFLSSRITQPLSLIRQKLRGIQLGKRNEHINYQADDEIGALVKEYNHKVDELMESAELLARSERESAWREMAKQIAHEIKNPLTPMKLNIQYLQRAKEEGMERYDDFFKRVTQNLIEQIDTLSGIATEFSNFAKIPQAKKEVFNLIEVIQNVVSLFETNQNISIRLDTNQSGGILVFIDKEQFSRAVINLVKNGIQAIPAEQIGEIRISVQTTGSTAVIQITDNGTGISPEAQENLFQPNFTTKTSGMGLGLSIVKNIIDNFGGKIWYKTKWKAGTTFYVEIPLYKPEQENQK
jgi:two-component system, NtrC family, nitrogen regulation sensor histidine kinase NtrY